MWVLFVLNFLTCTTKNWFKFDNWFGIDSDGIYLSGNWYGRNWFGW